MKTYLAVAIVLAIITVTCVSSSALDDYVNTPDAHYKYDYLRSLSAPSATVHVLNMTSQKWLTDAVTTNPIWFHHVYIVVPAQVKHPDTASIIIGLGNNPDPLVNLTDPDLKRAVVVAATTGAVAAVVKQVPNQPIVFQEDPNHTNRIEDAIVSWAWNKFLHNTSNPDILLFLPMTKAVVRGMDTVSSYISSVNGNVITKFMVAGRSKRGWTTWTTAAVDKRVIAIAPTVMDLLNMKQNLHHHYRSLGGWTFALADYYFANVTSNIDHQSFLLLQDIVDPLAYNSRYHIPKLIITSSGDEFCLLDDSHYFYDQLQSPKYLRVYPNAAHIMAATEFSYNNDVANFFLNVLENATIPEVIWVLSQTGYGGKITAKTSQAPNNVTAYYAVTADDKRRDFRLNVFDPVTNSYKSNPVVWHSINTTKINDLEYEVDVTRTPTGWLAFFLEFHFSGIHNSTLVFTSQVNIVPDIFAFPECSGTSCFGTLV